MVGLQHSFKAAPVSDNIEIARLNCRIILCMNIFVKALYKAVKGAIISISELLLLTKFVSISLASTDLYFFKRIISIS